MSDEITEELSDADADELLKEFPTDPNEIHSIHILVHGTVQGVFFRAGVKKEADKLGINGWVRNDESGKMVELVVEGTQDAIGKFLTWCAKGTPASKVKQVEYQWLKDKFDFKEFTIKEE